MIRINNGIVAVEVKEMEMSSGAQSWGQVNSKLEEGDSVCVKATIFNASIDEEDKKYIDSLM